MISRSCMQKDESEGQIIVCSQVLAMSWQTSQSICTACCGVHYIQAHIAGTWLSCWHRTSIHQGNFNLSQPG